MRVVLLGEISGTRDGRDWPPRGSLMELPDEEAVVLISGQMARPADPQETVETAVGDVVDVETRPLSTASVRGPAVPARSLAADEGFGPAGGEATVSPPKPARTRRS